MAEKRVSLVDLSSNSKESLAEFFNLGHDVLNSRDLLRLIADSDFYLQTRLELSELQQVSANNSQLEKLTAREALSICKQNHIGKSDKYLKLVNLADKLGTQKTLRLNQFLTLSTEVNSGQKKQLDLGTAYLYASFKGELIQFKQTLSNHLALCYLKAQGIISDDESEQLDNFNEKFAALSEIQYNDIRHLRTDCNLSSILELDVGYYQLMVDNTLLNITVEKIDEKYSYSIYDTEGGESNFYGIDKSEVSRKALSFIEGYVVSNIKAQSAQDYKLYSWEFSNGEVGGSSFLLNEFYQQSLSTERQRLVELGHTFFNQQKIAFSTLSDMGAVLDGKLLTAAAVANNPDWQTKLRFDPFLINDFYSLPDQTSVEQQQSVKVIKCLLNSKDSNNNLLNDHPDPNVIQDARRYLTAINLSADLNSNTNPKLWDRLIQASAQSSRFQSFGQKVGTATQAIGVLTLSISTYGMAKRLRDPNITDEERKEITKQLAINWSSISVDFGTDLMQSTFDKLHSYFSKKLLSSSPAGVGRIGYKMAAKTAKYAGAGLNLASAGFDIHEAIEHISKAVSEKNPDLKIDYIVNGSLATIGALVSITTAIALAMGLATAGPVGITLGAALMVGGMIFNAARNVQYIKAQVDLSAGEELETGWNLFIGAEPPYSVRKKLAEIMQSKFNEYINESIKSTLKKELNPIGFNRYIHTGEKFRPTTETKFIVTHKIDSEFESYSQEELENRYPRLKESYANLSGLAVESKISNFLTKLKPNIRSIQRYYLMRYKRNPISHFEYVRWKDSVDINNYSITRVKNDYYGSTESKYSVIIKNYNLFNSYQLYENKSHLLSLVNENNTYEVMGDIQGNENTHFRVATSDNIIFGYQNLRNSFYIGGGKNFFVGGDRDDLFSMTTFWARTEQSSPNYIDGQGGDNTLLLGGLSVGNKGFHVNLRKGEVYLSGFENKGDWAK